MKSNKSSHESKSSSRGKPSDEKPFHWQSNAAKDRIREFEDMDNLTATIAIYDVLTEIASRKGNSSDSFTEPQRTIMQLAGVHTRDTLRKHLGYLCEMKLLKVKKNRYPDGAIAPSTYTLLSAKGVCEPLAEVGERRSSTKREFNNKGRTARNVPKCVKNTCGSSLADGFNRVKEKEYERTW
jgi:hypothetical protein